MASTIATVDIKGFHENYLYLKENYRDYGERFVYVLATTCLLSDPNIDLEIALKLRPYGGIIGIDNSSLNKYFKSFKILRLHAILYDATGFVYAFSEKGLRFTLSNHKRIYWSRDRPCILSLCENFQRTIVQYVGKPKSRAVVLDFERFRNKSGFILKELAIATDNFIDLISFLPPNSNRSDQKSYQWASKFLHGLL